MTKVYGLIGKTLSYSFSKNYFTTKFRNEGIEGCIYELFEMDSIQELPLLLKRESSIAGLNVTIPYKTDVIPLIDELDISAQKIGAVNVIRRVGERLTGYNSDYYGFKQSLVAWLPPAQVAGGKALILGTGGAHQAVKVALEDLGIEVKAVSRTASTDVITYGDLTRETMNEYRLIVNTTPLGTHPEVDARPPIPYDYISSHHFLYDLVYNPEMTSFMHAGKQAGAKVKNGLEMLQLQAEKSWEIWNS